MKSDRQDQFFTCRVTNKFPKTLLPLKNKLLQNKIDNNIDKLEKYICYTLSSIYVVLRPIHTKGFATGIYKPQGHAAGAKLLRVYQ